MGINGVDITDGSNTFNAAVDRGIRGYVDNKVIFQLDYSGQSIGGFSFDSNHLWTGTKTDDKYSSSGLTLCAGHPGESGVAASAAIHMPECYIDSSGIHINKAYIGDKYSTNCWIIDRTSFNFNTTTGGSESWEGEDNGDPQGAYIAMKTTRNEIRVGNNVYPSWYGGTGCLLYIKVNSSYSLSNGNLFASYYDVSATSSVYDDLFGYKSYAIYVKNGAAEFHGDTIMTQQLKLGSKAIDVICGSGDGSNSNISVVDGYYRYCPGYTEGKTQHPILYLLTREALDADVINLIQTQANDVHLEGQFPINYTPNIRDREPYYDPWLSLPVMTFSDSKIYFQMYDTDNNLRTETRSFYQYQYRVFDGKEITIVNHTRRNATIKYVGIEAQGTQNNFMNSSCYKRVVREIGISAGRARTFRYVKSKSFKPYESFLGMLTGMPYYDDHWIVGQEIVIA